MTVLAVAREFGVAEEIVRRWLRQAADDDGLKDGMASAEKSEFVRLTCGVLESSAQASYAWNTDTISLRDLGDAYAITHWITYAYNRKGRQGGLWRLTRIKFELAFTSITIHAAT